MIPFLVALIGSSIAAIWDLKTTEIPDIIPHLMIFFAIVYYVFIGYASGSFFLLSESLKYGFLLLFSGFGLYFLGQWGGGDAKLLSAISFLMPINFFGKNFFPFPLVFTFNLFVIGTVYIVVYAFVFSLKKRELWKFFMKEIRKSFKNIVVSSALTFVLLSAIGLSFLQYLLCLEFVILTSLIASVFTVFMFLIMIFLRVVERYGFRKKIKLKDLKVGDVLLNSKVWEGVTKSKIRELKKTGKRYVWIKEGVRFGGAFPIALIFSVFYGEFLFSLIFAF